MIPMEENRKAAFIYFLSKLIEVSSSVIFCFIEIITHESNEDAVALRNVWGGG